MGRFFNFSSRVATEWWDRRSFLRAWWRRNARDRRWTPPAWTPISRALVQRAEPHIQRFTPLFVELEAVERPRLKGAGHAEWGMGPLPASAGEVRVGQAALLLDPRHGVAHVALLEVANDEECVEALLGTAAEHAFEAGCPRLLLVTGFAPAFPTGVLVNAFDCDPPLHTAYNAPFLGDLLGELCQTVLSRRVWHIDVASAREEAPSPAAGVEILPAPAGLPATELAPLVAALWAQGGGANAGLRPPDADEIGFLLRQWAVAPFSLLVARRGGEAVGLALLQPDVSKQVRRMKGGVEWWGRLGLAVFPPGSATAGRLLLGGVAPPAQRSGVGSALWQASLAVARSAAWQTLAIGPVDEAGPTGAGATGAGATEAFLRKRGARPLQQSVVYAYGG